MEIWDVYVKMELGWVEMLRRRWERLGIAIAISATPTPATAMVITGSSNKVHEPTSDLMGDADTLEVSGNASETARRRILQGAIVKEVMEDTMKGLS
jgi:U3 small nucleolar RNA-associated protein 6